MTVRMAKLINDPNGNWCYKPEVDEGSGGRWIEVLRGRMRGRSSSINGMFFVRGQAQDYDHQAKLSNRGSKALTPYILASRAQHLDQMKPEGGLGHWWLQCAQHHGETRLCISLPCLVSFKENISRKRPKLNWDKTRLLSQYFGE
jgi:choline dehydrogenase-like flavoprotein